MTGEPQPLSIEGPKPQAELLPPPTERSKGFPQSERDRQKGNWQSAIDTVWNHNRPLLDDDYAKAESIIAEKGSDFENLNLDDKKVKDEVTRRQQEQESARTEDPTQVSSEIVDQIANKLIAVDKDFKGKEITDHQVRQAAAQREIARRTELREKFDILYAPRRAREAAQTAIKGAITEAEQAMDFKIQEDISATVKAKNDTRAESEPEITQLATDEEQAIRDKYAQTELQIAEITNTITPRYYDQEQGAYHKINMDGTPSDKIDRYHDTYPPMIAELQRIAKISRDEKPTPEAQQAQKILDDLEYNPSENRFKFYTENEIREKETIEIERQMIGLGVDLVYEDIIHTKTKDGKDIIDFERDEKGNIKRDTEGHAIIKEFHKELLKNVDPHEPTARLLILVGAYHDSATPESAKKNIAALIFQEVSARSPEKLKDLGDTSIFEDRIKNLVKTFREEWLIPAGYDPVITPAEKLVDYLITASICEGHLEFDARGYPTGIDKAARKSIENWDLFSLKDQKIIIALASNQKSANAFCQRELGIDIGSEDNELTKRYVNNAVNAIGERRNGNGQPMNNDEKGYYMEIGNHYLSHESLDSIANQRGLNFKRRLGIALLLLGMFGGNIQKGLDEGDVKGQQGAPSD